MIIWDSLSLSKALGITAREGIKTGIVQFNSKDVRAGDLFIALPGEKNDGHNFVEDAFANGAAAAIIEEAKLPSGLMEKHAGQLMLVDSTLRALAALAEFKRNTSTAQIIAVTGSVGKTSTKEAIGHILSYDGLTFTSRGNFNNALGLQINLASLTPNAKYAVFEIGMNHPGEIKPLSEMLRPSIVVITNIHEVHLEFFNSVAGIATEKAQICAGCAPGKGIAILNYDSPYYGDLATIAKEYSINQIYSFGIKNEADCQLIDYHEVNGKAQATYQLNNHVISANLGITGKHQAANIASAILIAHMNGLKLETIKEALAHLSSHAGRGKVIERSFAGNRVQIIDDCYNASPASIKAALEALKLKQAQNKIAILGDMLELGIDGPALHISLKDHIIDSGVTTLVTVGPIMQYLHQEMNDIGHIKSKYFATVDDLLNNLINIITPESIVLLKASKGMKFAKILQYLDKMDVANHDL